MNAKVLVFLAATALHSSYADYLPPYIKPCDLKSPDFQNCVKEQMEETLPHFVRGIPELDVASIDPFDLDDIKIDGNNLKLHFTKAVMHGLGTSKITKFFIDLQKEEFKMEFRCDINVTAKYTIDGQILILPIKGQGDAVVVGDKIDVKIGSKLTRVKDAKGEHLKLVQPNYTYNIFKTTFKFENLFNGNQQLSEATHKFANENWQQIMDDVAPPAIKQIVKTSVKAINKFFSKVTLQQIIKNA